MVRSGLTELLSFPAHSVIRTGTLLLVLISPIAHRRSCCVCTGHTPPIRRSQHRRCVLCSVTRLLPRLSSVRISADVPGRGEHRADMADSDPPPSIPVPAQDRSVSTDTLLSFYGARCVYCMYGEERTTACLGLPGTCSSSMTLSPGMYVWGSMR